MAFTFNADPQSASMNSYVTVAEADDYFSAKFGAEGWADLEQVTKEALLYEATNILETFQFDGQRTVRTQPLKWPRKLIYNEESVEQPSNVVHPKVKIATFEMAYWKWTEEDRPATDAELEQLESSKIGPLDYTFKKGVSRIPAHVIDILKGIGPGVLISAPGSKQGVRSITL